MTAVGCRAVISLAELNDGNQPETVLRAYLTDLCRCRPH